MVKHKCIKEKELDELNKYVIEQRVITQKIKDDIGYIKKALAGNGEQGLIKEVEQNTTYRIGAIARANLTKFLVGSGWTVTILLFYLSYIKLH